MAGILTSPRDAHAAALLLGLADEGGLQSNGEVGSAPPAAAAAARMVAAAAEAVGPTSTHNDRHVMSSAHNARLVIRQ